MVESEALADEAAGWGEEPGDAHGGSHRPQPASAAPSGRATWRKGAAPVRERVFALALPHDWHTMAPQPAGARPPSTAMGACVGSPPDNLIPINVLLLLLVQG